MPGEEDARARPPSARTGNGNGKAGCKGASSASGKAGKAAGPPDDYFRKLIDNALDIFMIIDGEGRIRYINRAVRKTLGYEPDEMVGSSAFDFVHPEDAALAAEIVQRAVVDPEYSVLHELRVLHKDGSSRYLAGIGKSYLADPAIAGMVVSFRDITDRKKVEEELRASEELHRSLVAASPDAVTMADLEGKLVYVSPQTVKLHGYGSEQELLGGSAFDLIAPEDHARAASAVQSLLKEGTAKNMEFTLLRKDGTRFTGELNGALIRDADGNPYRMVAYTRDITERKRIERELRERNEELEAFAHTISHDLLNPVAIVEGYAKAALEADAEGRADAERECLEAIVKGARRMSDLIDSLLQYAQAGHVDAQVHAADPEEALMEALTDLEEEVRQKGARVEVVNDLPRVRVEGVKLRQVFSNLIGNALKHMGEMAEPHIEVGAEAQGDTATFFVRDNGIGIPEELQKIIYEPFRHFSLTGSTGLGIGLSTVKRAVTAWGGSTWVVSKPGEGATFFFTAPLAE